MSAIDMPDDPAIEEEIRTTLLNLPLKTRVALLSDLKVRNPDGFIPKARVSVLSRLHDVYVFPAGDRTPCAVVVRRGYDDRHILAGVSLQRVTREEAEAMAARVLGLPGAPQDADDAAAGKPE